MKTIQDVIDYMESTDENSWNLDTVRSKDGSRNCFFGHLFDMGEDEREANEIWDWFESEWATTYRIYPINDGEDPKYQQATPKARVVAYLLALRDGLEKTTMEQMKEDYQYFLSDILSVDATLNVVIHDFNRVVLSDAIAKLCALCAGVTSPGPFIPGTANDS